MFTCHPFLLPPYTHDIFFQFRYMYQVLPVVSNYFYMPAHQAFQSYTWTYIDTSIFYIYNLADSWSPLVNLDIAAIVTATN